MLLITGATGFTGSYFVEKLSSAQYKGKIRCIVRKDSDVSQLNQTNLDIEFCVGNLEDNNFLNESMRGVNTVVHIASIRYSESITNAALINGVNWVIYVHTTGIYSKLKEASKDYIRIEDHVINSGITYTILRPTMIYGSPKDKNMHKLIEHISTNKLFPVFGGNSLMQPIYGMDLGYSIYSVLLARDRALNKGYDLSGKYPIKYIDILKTVSKLLDKKVIFIQIPLKLCYYAAILYNSFFNNPKISVEQVMRMSEDKNYAHDEATKDFGFNPLSFEEGIEIQIKEFLAAN